MTHLAPEVCATLLGVFAALAIVSVAVAVWKWRKPGRNFASLAQRIRTWWVIAGLFSLSLLWSTTATIVFLAFVSYLALKEFLSMTPTRRADRRVLFYAYLSVIAQYYLAGSGRYQWFLVFIPVVMFIWLPTRMWMIGRTEGFLQAAGTLHWGLMITVFSLSHAAFLVVFDLGDAPLAPVADRQSMSSNPGPGLLVFLVLITELNDILQHAWGRIVRDRQVAFRISPGRTYAGLIGGAASTVLMAVVLGPYVTLMDWPRALLAGVIITTAGFAGNFCLSAMKRDLRIRDFGATLPGHGGVLDRVDSLIFTAPLFFHFIHYCYG